MTTLPCPGPPRLFSGLSSRLSGEHPLPRRGPRLFSGLTTPAFPGARELPLPAPAVPRQCVISSAADEARREQSQGDLQRRSQLSDQCISNRIACPCNLQTRSAEYQGCSKGRESPIRLRAASYVHV